MKHSFDFDNADLCMILIASLMITLVITAASSTQLSFNDILPFLDKMFLAMMTLATPGGLAKMIRRNQDLRVQRPVPPDKPPANPETDEPPARS